ncbi:beta-amyrin 28-monooxygenase-like [Prunus dulcis]|nr:beta-amyrin 28-monooxygenase-like [Prunus dulcis]XP_034218865.1 beta-amyrin 28-monooxygenase-like [Prunus dulcis]
MEELLMILISSVLVCVPLYYYIFKIRVNGTKIERLDQHKLPPGSTGWPIIGETLEYLRTGKKGVPEKFIADRRNKYKNSSSSSSSANCKVFKTSLLFEDMAVLCTAAGNKFLFSNEKKLVKSWWPPHLDKLIFADSAPDEKAKSFITEESTQFRNTMSPYLKPACLQKYVGTMDVFTKKHLDMYWEDGKDDDQVIKAHPLAKRYAVTMACRLMLDTEDQQVFTKLENLTKDLSSGFTSLPIDLPGTQFNRAIRGSRQLREEIKNIVTQRRIHLSTRKVDENVDGLDILSSLIMDTSSDGQGLSDSEIASKLYGVIVSGYDTFSSTLAAMVMCLAELPHVYDAVLKEQRQIAESKAAGELLNWADIQKMKYSWSVACEVMRLLPPNSGTFREAISDFVYEGYLIPKGMKLNWSVHSTHKNPEYFPDPEKFDPSRFEGQGPPPYSFVPFGGGPRMCPGKEYARLKMLVFMHNVVTRYRWEKVFPDEKFVWHPALIPTKGLPIRVFPHNKSESN